MFEQTVTTLTEAGRQRAAFMRGVGSIFVGAAYRVAVDRLAVTSMLVQPQAAE